MVIVGRGPLLRIKAGPTIVLNLWPRRAATPGHFGHDGETARMAFARHRAGVPPLTAATPAGSG
jgi:hypothetical protein